MSTQTKSAKLQRELGATGATMLGLGSIIGTGIFVGIGVSAGITGPAVLLAILLAAALAACNALSSAQLAAAHPVSGGTYEHGYRLLTPTLGFTAGWMFLCAKSASAATAALGAAGYALSLVGLEPGRLLPWAGLTITALLVALTLSGLRRSSMVNSLIVSVTLAALAGFVIAGLTQLASNDAWRRFTPFLQPGADGPVPSFLYATALMFVAYTGYGRIATMGEEVQSPRTTIPRAIIATLIVSATLYLLVAAAAIAAVGPSALSGTARGAATPLEAAARALDMSGLGVIVATGAVTAMVGVLLNLVLGLSRVALAMGRRGDFPPATARLSAKGSPRAAILLVGVAVAGLTLTGNVETTWGFSAFTVLIYYAITNLAALRLPAHQRLYPSCIAWVGLAGCLCLAAFLPRTIWLPGLGVIAGGLVWRWIARTLWPQGARPAEADTPANG